MHKSRKTSIVGIIITIIILIVLVIVSNINVNDLSQVENALGKLVMPIQNGLTYLKNKLAGNESFFTNISNLQEENENLKEENKNLQESLRELEIIKSENATLREYVNLKEKYAEYSTIPAYIINKDITNYNNTVIINVGKRDGVDINMPVISEKGLVGYIISVTDSTAKVQTIIDASSTVSCTITSSRDNIIVRGTLSKDSNLKATFIPTDANIIEGETIQTSGIGGIYPKGILVGTVKQVINTKNITDRYAIIETVVDFTKLDTVLVITK